MYKEHVGRAGSCAWTPVHYSGCYAKHCSCMVTGSNGSATLLFKRQSVFTFTVTVFFLRKIYRDSVNIPIGGIAKFYHFPG